MMFIRKRDMKYEKKENVRGGKGVTKIAYYLNEGMQERIKFISVVEVEPLSSIGEHFHYDEEETYIIIKGKGIAKIDGKSFFVEEGDAFLCKKNHSHAIEATEEGITFLAIMSY